MNTLGNTQYSLLSTIWLAVVSHAFFMQVVNTLVRLWIARQTLKFVLLINLKLLTIANLFLLNIIEHEIFSANKYENANYLLAFSYLLAENISCSADDE